MTHGRDKVLHIVNWYPNPLDSIEGHFIKDQIDALNIFVPSDVIQIQVRYGKPAIIKRAVTSRERIWILQVPVKSWFIKEILSSMALYYFLFFKYDLSNYRLVNFHIAYPLLTYLRFFKWMLRVPIVITEHWSAYHFNFGVTKELRRVKRIFSLDVPVITVSRSLATDISIFSGRSLTTYQLANVVNHSIFRTADKRSQEEVRFFMLGCWQTPKTPGVIIDALHQLHREGYTFSLRIGGYGPYEEELREKIRALGMERYASFIGKLTFEEVASEMQNSSFFLHASNYETFSLVCAEALCCGTPVVASAVGGIPEYLTDKNGILVPTNSVESWSDAAKRCFEMDFDRSWIARDGFRRFSIERIGKDYQKILDQITTAGNG